MVTKHQILMRSVSSKGEECTRVVDESEAQGPEDELVPVAPNMGAGGSHPQATLNQEWAEDMREIRRMVEFLVRRERKLDVKADVAIRRLERLERENLQLEDEVLESSLPEALADKTKVVKLLVDKWFVDKGFGFGKVPSGEVVFIHASVVQGAEVLMIGTEAWDDARAQGGFRARRAWGKIAWEQERDRERASKAAERARRAAELTAELAAQSERAVSEVCTHPPGLPRDEPTAERSVAPTAGDSPFLTGGDSLLSGRSSPAPRPRGARARSIAPKRRCEVFGRRDAGLLRQSHWRRRSPDAPEARKHESSRAAANRERWQKRAEEVQRFQDKREEARALFRRQGGLEERFEREFKQQVMRSIGHNREDDEKSLDKWTNELRAKAEAERDQEDEAGGRPLSKASQQCENLSYSLKVNESADLAICEFASWYPGGKHSNVLSDLKHLGVMSTSGNHPVNVMDWTQKGVVTPVKNREQQP